VFGKNQHGALSVKEASEDPIFQDLVGGNLTHLLQGQTNVTGYQNKTTTSEPQPAYTGINQDTISIENKLKPALLAAYENVTSPTASALSDKCLDVQYGYFEWNSGHEGCPIWMRSHSALGDTLTMIGNVSSGTGILILQGENDTTTPVEQGLLLQQRLTNRGKSSLPPYYHLSKPWTFTFSLQRMGKPEWSNERLCPTRYV